MNQSQQPVHRMRTRFAPSPTGYLHLGHIVSALYVWGIGRAVNAEIILRIEDHDRGRCRPEYEEAILRDLEWLGFAPDHGVSVIGRPSPYRQSDCQRRYVTLAESLVQRQLAFYCRCSRKQIADSAPIADGEEARYPGTCRAKQWPPDKNCGLRLSVADEEILFCDLCVAEQRHNPQQQCGDFLLRDREQNFSYHYCVVIDDLDQKINLIVRGQDLLGSTGRQIYFRNLIALPTQKAALNFYHHPLVLDAGGQKLSKRKFSDAIAVHRQEGARVRTILAQAIAAMGVKELSEADSLTAVSDYFAENLEASMLK